MYNNSIGYTKAQIESSSLNQLDQIKTLLDLRLKELNDIAVRIAYDPTLTPFMVRNNRVAAKTAIEELQKYKVNSSIIDSVFVYFRGDDTIYSQNGSQSLGVLAKEYKMTDASLLRLTDDLNHSETTLLRPDWSEDLIAFYYPIKPKESFHYGTVLYTIQKSVLSNYINDILDGLDRSIVIFDKNLKTWAAHTEGVDVPFSHFQSMIRQRADSAGTGIQDIKLSGKRYSAIYVVSAKSGLTFAAIVPSKQFLQPVTHVQSFLFVLLGVIVFISLISAVWLAFKNTKPVRELANFIRKGWGSGRRESRNELFLIREVFTEVYDHRGALMKKVDLQQPWAIERVLSKLLNGSYKSTEDVETDLDIVGMYLNADHYFMLVFRHTDLDEVKSWLTALQEQYKCIYALESLHKNNIALLVGYERQSATHRQIQEQVADKLRNLLYRQNNPSFVIGIGTVYPQLLHVNHSFIEALAALEYEFTATNGSMIFFEDIHEWDNESLSVPLKEQIKFAESLKRGDKQVSLESLNHIFRNLNQKEQSVFSLKMVCNDIILQVHAIDKELNLDKASVQLKTLTKCRTFVELKEKLTCIVSDICNEVEQLKTKQSTMLGKLVIQFINSNFCNYDLSLDQLADKYNVSTSHLSRIIKEETGTPFMEYLTRLRMEFIKLKLVTTAAPIQSIIQEAGYFDVSNFIRKFRKSVGMTPGRYRAISTSPAKQKPDEVGHTV
ncbi:helix-turn-helix domain-containing protein [Cohnella zeiphila]|uniref:Helix-turn-helix domain-containing protein n=1 Tax=Cohnella zeiphila TaxID=2761120 RepID=A0A7X0VV13_9BACL|nr:helix-turn-helix domain-containing protein [Cohnella zeiphila]MBB6730882.1 helix-turn-helix domain-containing protein [Cohnella zeiphila]